MAYTSKKYHKKSKKRKSKLTRPRKSKRSHKYKKRISKATRKSRKFRRGGAALPPPKEPTEPHPDYNEKKQEEYKRADQEHMLKMGTPFYDPEAHQKLIQSQPQPRGRPKKRDIFGAAEPTDHDRILINRHKNDPNPFLSIIAKTTEENETTPELGMVSVPLDEVTDQSIAEIIQNNPKLSPVEIDLSNTLITDEGISELSKNIGGVNRQGTGLAALDLSNTGITDEGIISVVSNVADIEDINLSNCNNITDKGAAAIAKYCPDLQILTLDGTGITIEGVKKILEKCKKLVYTNITDVEGLENLTEDELDELHEKYLNILRWDFTPTADF